MTAPSPHLGYVVDTGYFELIKQFNTNLISNIAAIRGSDILEVGRWEMHV
jgi:hypothetical protein